MVPIKLSQEILSIFPYKEVRPIQDKLIHTIYSALKEKKNVVIEGANGLGKTVATLTACLPIARERKLQILHVCRTNKQTDRVIDELKEIAKKTAVNGISIRGRKEMCPHPLVEKYTDDSATAAVLCGQLKKLKKCDYYNRMNEQSPHMNNILKILMAAPTTSSEISALCEEYKICPYELILKLIENIDVIAASYQYIFNPPIREIFMNKTSRGLNEILLIVDECHNIIDVSLDISSDQLSLYSIKQALKEIRAFNYVQFIRLARLLEETLEENETRTEIEKKISASDLLWQLSKDVGATIDLDYVDKIISAGMKIQKEYLAMNKPPRSFLNHVGEFLKKLVITKTRTEFLHLITNYRTHNEGWGTRFEIISLDARYTTKKVLEAVSNSIHISGTIDPIDAYVKIVGLNYFPLITEVLDSPYTSDNIQGYVINQISTKYENRTKETYQTMCDIIGEAVNNTPTNTGIFAASYDVLESLLEAGIQKRITKPFFYESSNMTSKANDLLIEKFKALALQGGAALLGVLGGRSSEGADFPGAEMDTCVIVGIPYAKPTVRSESQIQYLDEQFEKRGREFGYLIPALRRAAQASGRLIRSLNDRGIIFFLDQRFIQPYTIRFLPLWLRENIRLLDYTQGKVASITKDFFDKN